MKILLFDVDGTLVRYGSDISRTHIYESFIHAFKEVNGINIKDEELHQYSGTTDMFIIGETLRKSGFNEAEISKGLPIVLKSMIRYVNENIGSRGTAGGMLDGVIETLDQLSRNNDYILGLVTGGLKEIVRMKLEALGIWRYFKIGGFGDSSKARTDIIDLAIAEAIEKKLVKNIDKKQVYMIGDTKNDIMSAKERGVVSVAVATGPYTKADLEIYKPDYLLSSLPELIQIL